MKLKTAIIAILVSALISFGIAEGAFPQTFTNWVAGNVITSAWLNAVEQSITGTSTNVAVINGLATTTGNIIVASSSAGWKVLTIGTNNNCLEASSTQPLGLAWGPCNTASIPISIANGGTATTSVPTANNLMYFDGNFIRGTSSVYYLASNPSNFVANTRLINTGQRLQGGGDLSADRTISLASSTANGDLLIGSGTGGLWNIGGLTGTANQLTVTNGSGTITLAIPNPLVQSVSSTAITFTNATGSGSLSIGTLNGVLKGTTGVVGTAANGTDFTLNTALTCGANNHLSAETAAGVFTCSADNPTSTIPITPITIANGGTNTSSVPTTNNLLFYNGTAITSTSTATTYNSLAGSVVLSGPSSTIDSSFFQWTPSVPVNITEIDCWDSTSAVTSTLSLDRRTSSTPNTAGPAMLVSLACGLTRAQSSTIAISTATRDFAVNFSVTSSAGYVSSSTLTVQWFFTK